MTTSPSSSQTTASARWTVPRRVRLGFAIVLALVALAGGLSLRALTQVLDANRRMSAAASDVIDAERMQSATLRKIASVRGALLTEDTSFRSAVDRASRRFRTLHERLRGRAGADDRLLDDIDTAERAHAAAVEQVLAQHAAGEDTQRTFRGVIQAHRELDRRIQALVDARTDTREAARTDAQAVGSSAWSWLIGLFVGCLLLGAFVAMRIVTGIRQSVLQTVETVRTSAAELSATAATQATGAREQATMMHEVSTTATELVSSADQIASTARGVSELAQAASDASSIGRDQVRETSRSVEALKEQAQDVVAHMLRLGKTSQEIGAILDLINELAEQTNILAINATIEAAGAGESGRRFAVVGDEIRKLAERVSNAARAIRTHIDDIRGAVNTTVMATETGAKASDAAAEQFGTLEQTFDALGDTIDRTAYAAREIELSTRQQTTAVQQVHTAIREASTTTADSETAAVQTAETADELAALAGRLEHIVGRR